MGWFSNAASWLGSKVTSVANYVVEKISHGLSIAREKASEACEWIAEKGEKFIDNVKSVYKKVKPYLEKVRPWLENMATVANQAGFPWAGLMLKGVGKVIDGLFSLENSPVAQKLEKALRGVIKFSQFVKERYLTPEEIQEAKEHKETFTQAENMDLTQEEAQSVQLAQMLNNYGLLKTQLRDVLEMGVGDFQHYLRLRATQKLLDEADYKLTTTQNIDEVHPDDLFLINTAENLISTAELSQRDAIRLNEITQKRFGKPLIPFVFEELLVVWVQKQEGLEEAWKECSHELSQKSVSKTRLEVSRKISGLTSEENIEYENLLAQVMGLETKLNRLDKERRSMKNYLYAAEGFMQILEKDDEQLEAEDKDYLIDDSAEIASIIMRVAQNNVDWDSLTTDEQSLIIDYANIFEQEGKARAESLAKEINMEITA